MWVNLRARCFCTIFLRIFVCCFVRLMRSLLRFYVLVFCFFVLSKSKSNSSTVFPLHVSIGNHNPLRIPKRNCILCSVDTTMIIQFRMPTKHLLWPISICTLICSISAHALLS